MCVCTCVCVRACVRVRVQTYMYTYVHAYMCACVHVCMLACLHACMPVCERGRVRGERARSDVQVCHQRKDTTLMVFDLILSPILNQVLNPSPSPMNTVISQRIQILLAQLDIHVYGRDRQRVRKIYWVICVVHLIVPNVRFSKYHTVNYTHKIYHAPSETRDSQE